ncbi:MAG: class I SAM-dependent methyltransferase [Sphingomonadaceae bacterium]|nr:class I SAM-dependent methyltransferase [Sphingomonadaceae bacterium]
MWRLKILGKIVLSRLPFGYGVWRRLGLFRHGKMNQADYALGVVTHHLERLGGADRIKGAVCLELGPGDSLSSAIIAHALGARKTYLVDVGDFADRDIETYRGVAGALSARGIRAADLSAVSTIEEMLRAVDAEYLTDGLRSLREIPAASVDLIWSQAVLEHIRLREVHEMFAELHRIMKPAGAMSHRIDYKDHLQSSLNNLRFSEKVWESEFMAGSGFYTNRMRNAEMLGAMKQAGFELLSAEPGKWDRLPVPRARLHRRFQALDEDDLRTKHVDVVARPAQPS